MDKDPGQFRNLAVTKNPPAALAEMREMMKARLEESGL